MYSVCFRSFNVYLYCVTFLVIYLVNASFTLLVNSTFKLETCSVVFPTRLTSH